MVFPSMSPAIAVPSSLHPSSNIEHQAPLHFGIQFAGRRPIRTSQSDPKAIPSPLLLVPTGQLGRSASACRIRLQQRPQCFNRCFANKGYHPALDIHPERNVSSLRAREFAANINKLHDYLAESLKLAQERYQITSDERRIPPLIITPGEKVFLLSKYSKTTRHLPHELRLIHPVFHIS
jgi:hypothetical protein